MTAKPEPTTWKIFPTKGGQFQWVAASGNPDSGSERPTATLVPEEDIKPESRFPSMMDILIQAAQSNYLRNNSWCHDGHLAGPLKPVEIRGDNGGGGAMFSSGSGRRLSVQRSSIMKARSILEEEDIVDKASCSSECFPMFRTGLGKSVQVRQSSIKKAEALLEVSNDNEEHNMHEPSDTRSVCPPLKFHTAGGRSISFSADALKRARNLLNDLELDALEGEAKANPPTYSSVENDKIYNESSCNVKSISFGISPSVKHFCSPLMAPTPSRMIRGSSSACGALVDISNYPDSSLKNKSWINGEKKRPGKESSSSSFKKPRTSRFTAPLNHSSSSLAETEAAMPSTSVNCCCRARVSSHYPFQLKRKKLKEFFGAPPGRFSNFENIPDKIKFMTPDSAEKYQFRDTFYSVEFGPEAFREMLLRSGALLADASEKWVANHYKWIVWKLTCLERSYPDKAIGKLLTVCNVLEELKYRYEREVNYGHKSAFKKMLDGDVLPSSMMILCVSAIHSYSSSRNDEVLVSFDLHGNQKNPVGIGSNHAAKIELTDGWYSLDATLDGHLSKQLHAGKLFVGQKLRVCGAAFCGWVEPISPLEASNSVSLVLHINGTYRAHWADSLGLCRRIGAPLSFRCIKNGGGKIPMVLVGVTRLYPVLYKERLQGGGSIVRSESLEKKILELNNKRRSDIVEDIISEVDDAPLNLNENEEGAKLLRILETSAEPEVLMAGMSLEQLNSFSSFQAKREALRQANLCKKIDKALEEAGLGSRDVSPFMRVRVIGLTSIDSCRKGRPREGLITIWNPTERQKLDLLEGQIYSVSWLTPFIGSCDFLYLQSRGPSSEWIRLPATEYKKYDSFFIPRKSVFLSNLGEVPLASEFDISAVVVYVGEAYLTARQRKQWIFVADGSGWICDSLNEDEHDGLLAISFCSPISGSDSLEQFNQCLSGSTVGFYNLIKRPRDRNNHLWVAEATENSVYSISHNIPCDSHLKGAADSSLKWAKAFPLALKKLQERVLSITGGLGV